MFAHPIRNGRFWLWNSRRRVAFLLVALLFDNSPILIFAASRPTREKLKLFTVADDIGLSHFSDAPSFSPNGLYCVVLSERGRLDLNLPESSIRIYRTKDVEHFLSHSQTEREPSPFWTIRKSAYRDGPIITDLRWLKNSSAVAFLAKTVAGNDQLLLANIQRKTVQPLTPEDQQVTAFDVLSSVQFVYTVLSPAIHDTDQHDGEPSAMVGTGRSIWSLIFTKQAVGHDIWVHDLSELWISIHGKRTRIVDAASGKPIPIHLEGQRALALSPDGRSVVTALTVSDIPSEWERLFPPPFPSDPYRVRAGPQNPEGFTGQRDVSEFVLIDLVTGQIEHLTRAPIGNTAGWVGLTNSDWSSDGRLVVLSDTFLPPTENRTEKRPCVAVAEVTTNKLTCLEPLKIEVGGSNDEEHWRIHDVRFVSGEKSVVRIRYWGGQAKIYALSSEGSWTIVNTIGPDRSIDIFIKQGLNEPPVLIATYKKAHISRVIWTPNPQLKNIKLGQVSVLNWTDKSGRAWVGGLYRPPDYVNGKRYPLIIQTHGFDQQEFQPSGIFSTAFAAQELAAAGFLVLQLEDCPIRTTPEEGPCQVAGYEAALRQLAKTVRVDMDRIGIVGFSRTCYYVLESLTAGTLHFAAASITDGIDQGYLQYLMSLDSGGNGVSHEADATIGARPFGAGLQTWLKRSPVFNMDKVNTPLQVVALGRRSLMEMWEPYATLRYLDRPVDFIIVKSEEHILTNPAARAVSQGGTVDWFRFWLQGYEDSDPRKIEQYKRWRTMRARRDAALSGVAGR